MTKWLVEEIGAFGTERYRTVGTIAATAQVTIKSRHLLREETRQMSAGNAKNGRNVVLHKNPTPSHKPADAARHTDGLLDWKLRSALKTAAVERRSRMVSLYA